MRDIVHVRHGLADAFDDLPGAAQRVWKGPVECDARISASVILMESSAILLLGVLLVLAAVRFLAWLASLAFRLVTLLVLIVILAALVAFR